MSASSLSTVEAGKLAQFGRQRLLREHHARLAVPYHECQPLGRRAWIQRDVGAAGLERGEQRHQHLRSALHHDRDPRIGANPERHQVMRQPVGPPVQLGVSQIAILEHHRDGVRRARNLGLDELRQHSACQQRFRQHRLGQYRPARSRGRLVPFVQHSMPLADAQDREQTDRDLRAGRDDFEQVQKALPVAVESRRVIVCGMRAELHGSVGVAAGVNGDRKIFHPPGMDKHIHARRPARELAFSVARHEIQNGAIDVGLVRRQPEVAPQGARPIPLMAESLTDARSRLRQELGKRRIRADLEAQRHDIGKDAGYAAQFPAGACRHRHTQNHVTRTGHPEDICSRSRGDHCHQTGVMGRPELFQGFDDVARNAAGAVDHCMRPLRRLARQGRCLRMVLEPFTPVALVALTSGRECVARFIVEKLAPRCRLVRRTHLAIDLRAVKVGHPAQNQRDPERIANEVVHARVAKRAVIRDLDQRMPKKRPLAEVKWPLHISPHPGHGRRARILGAAHIDEWYGSVQETADDLPWSRRGGDEGQVRSVDFRQGLSHGRFEKAALDRPLDLHVSADVVEGAVGRQPLRAPDVRLGNGERQHCRRRQVTGGP
jgi:hypothetical protein